MPLRRKGLSNVLVLVGMVESSHFQSWLKATLEERIFGQIWVVPSDYPVNKLNINSLKLSQDVRCKLKVFHFPVNSSINNWLFRGLDLLLGSQWRSVVIFRYIRRARPNFFHFHELQHGAYLFNSISKFFENERSFKTICSTWGSDLLFYGSLSSHKNSIKNVLSWTDTLTAERSEDMAIAEKLGYSGDFLYPVYINVGAKLPIAMPIKLPSSRYGIIIKGIQDNHGRALNALAALSLIEIDLSCYQIRVFSAREAVRLQVEFLRDLHGWDIQVLNKMDKSELEEIFKLSRIYIGLSISDGLPSSLIEAISNGAFPIQSVNSAAQNLVVDKVSGFLVNPWQIETIAEKITIALTNDKLVDEAVACNLQNITDRYNYKDGIHSLQKLYEK